MALLHSSTGAPGRSAVVAALFCLHPLHAESVAWIAERKDMLSTFFAMLSLLANPMSLPVANALVAYVGYLLKTIWPAGLSYFYPVDTQWIGWRAIASAMVLAAISIAVVLQARAQRFLAVGWFWYLGTLVPVIGLLQVGSQAMADRYTYFPLIGLFIAIVWSVPERSIRLHPAFVATLAPPASVRWRSQAGSR